MESQQQSTITNLKLDLEELQTLYLDSTRPNVKAFINSHILSLEQ
jgi:hypothetical protein